MSSPRTYSLPQSYLTVAVSFACYGNDGRPSSQELPPNIRQIVFRFKEEA